MFLVYLMCKSFYQSEKQDQFLTEFFMEYKKIYEELNMLMPFSPDVKAQQSQREQMAVMGFLSALPSEYDLAKAQILPSPEISSLQETFSMILRTEVSSSSVSSPTLVSAQTNSALVDRPLSQRGNKIETVVQAVKLEGMVLEVLFVITTISLAM